MTDKPSRNALRLFGLLCLAAVGALAIALWIYRDPPREGPAAAPMLPAGESAPHESASAQVPAIATAEAPAVLDLGASRPAAADRSTGQPDSTAAGSGRRLFHRYTGLDSNYGRMAFLEGPEGTRRFSNTLSCDVVYEAGGRGICLIAKRGVITTYSARLFDAASLQPDADFPLAGVPSRARVSADGKLAAYTVFLTGHGYATLDFSTQSVILDAATGESLLDLERDFKVMRDGKVIKEADFNFWGVTFTPDARGFYATLSTNRKHFLVRGDIAARTMTVLHENVECPSLSPDGRRVAYKKRLIENGRILWQLQVLDLATLAETVVGERRSIDDQLEWLDNGHVLYSVPRPDTEAGGGTDVWAAAADGRGEPRLLLANAYSPAVGR